MQKVGMLDFMIKKVFTANHTARKLAANKIPPIDLPMRQGEWQDAKKNPKRVPGQPRQHNGNKAILAATSEVQLAIARDRESGMTIRQVSEKYGVAASYVADAVKKHYVSARDGKAALRGVLLEGAIACGQQAHAKIEDLSGIQSVVATGIFTQRFIDMDKHIQETPDEVDMSDVEKAGALLKSLEGEEGILIEDHEDATIDIDDKE